MNVSTRDAKTALFVWPAAWACAVGFYGGEVVGEGCVAEVQGAGWNYGVAEALGGARHQQVRGPVDGERIRTAVLVGQTQSNMSAPRATETRRSSG